MNQMNLLRQLRVEFKECKINILADRIFLYIFDNISKTEIVSDVDDYYVNIVDEIQFRLNLARNINNVSSLPKLFNDVTNVVLPQYQYSFDILTDLVEGRRNSILDKVEGYFTDNVHILLKIDGYHHIGITLYELQTIDMSVEEWIEIVTTQSWDINSVMSEEKKISHKFKKFFIQLFRMLIYIEAERNIRNKILAVKNDIENLIISPKTGNIVGNNFLINIRYDHIKVTLTNRQVTSPRYISNYHIKSYIKIGITFDKTNHNYNFLNDLNVLNKSLNEIL